MVKSIILKGGFEVVIMCSIVVEVGFVNGVLKYYFFGKESIVVVMFEMIF